MFEQAFRNIDDVLRKEAGCTTELDYTEQTSWLLFQKYLDGFGYMGGNPYGGHRRFILKTPTAEHRAAFHLANDQLGGFWFRGQCSRENSLD